MNKRFIIGAIIVILIGIVSAALMHWVKKPATLAAFSEKELAEKSVELAAQLGQTNMPSQAILVPIDMSRPTRLAVGGLGLADHDKNQQLGDLVTVQLTGSPGFELVERQKLATILQELNLSLNHFVRAKDAVRVGKLLKVEWFLLGTEATIDKTNSIVARVVDARTGVIRDAGIFPADKPPQQLASDLATFLRQARENAAQAKLRTYLALGAFEDVGLNNRMAEFPSQLRGYLTAAYRGSDVTLLERDAVENLLQEVNLDLAGLTDDGGSTSPAAMQAAFWLVTGQYQSYGTSSLELNLDVQRIFGKTKHVTLRGQPGEPIYRRVKQEIDTVMKQSPESLVPTRVSEIRAQMAIGRELANLEQFDLIFPNNYQILDEQETARRRRNAEEAIKVFETVLLLDPDNREAKMFLAACLRKQTIGRVDEAREYYREILGEPVHDKWEGQAQEALKRALMESGGAIDWLKMAMGKSTNRAALEFYQEQLNSAQTEAIIQSGEGPNAKKLAEAKLFEDIAANFSLMQTGVGHGGGAFGMYDFAETYGTDQTAAGLRLAELYPKMKAEFPQLAPQLLEFVVTYQTGTNSPLIAEVEQSLDRQIAHPDEVYKSKYFTGGTAPLFQWSMHYKLYALALKVMARKLSVEGNNNIEQLDDQSKIALGYAYQATARWKDALAIFETYSNRPVVMYSAGPWGPSDAVVLTSKRSNLCRSKLGLPVVHNPHEFDMGKPLMCLCTPSAFSADDNGLWVGIGGQLLQLGFDLKTNLTINLPIEASTSITAICIAGAKVWVATDGAGLIEFDKNSREIRHFTVEDGLTMNRIACLYLAGDTLWIGYGYSPESGTFRMDPDLAQNGGLGQMDVASHKFLSFTPSIAKRPDAEEVNSDHMLPESISSPPRRTVQAVVASSDGTGWFATIKAPVRCYRKDQNVWEGFPSIRGRSLAINKEHLFVGQNWNFQASLGKNTGGPLGIHILNLKEGKWHDVAAFDGLPSASVNTLTLDGNQLWIGGVGYIALLDTTREKVLNFAYVPGSGVDHIQIAGGYVWAQFDWHLYRVPLSALQ